jgi:glycosyltransferase involved in cell wall biosynthesis
MADSLPRVMWLLNHSAARKFEVAMLKKLGFTEIFMPKSFPQEVSFRSASVDYSEDANLSIPADDLAILNAADWYHGPGRDAWEVANRHFDVLFFIMYDPSFIRTVTRHFRGAIIFRGYGLLRGRAYSEFVRRAVPETLANLGQRFWFGAAYAHLAETEPAWFRKRVVYLPAGLQDCQVTDVWNGENPTVFIVCPDVAANDVYEKIYREYREQLNGFRYVVGGAQSLASSDPNILGWVSDEQHQRNMREFRVMFYNNTEPNHVHYHPFEAVRAGMPLVFLGGGMLDRLGGTGLPGRCKDYKEARAKLRRILADDRGLIEDIRGSQVRLLDAMQPQKLEPVWRRGLARILSELKASRVRPSVPARPSRIAVILPIAYRGGTLRATKLLAQALWTGSREYGEDADVVFGYPDVHQEVRDRWDDDLPLSISRRTIQWQMLDPAAAGRAMHYAGHPGWVPSAASYLAPDDGVQELYDCDLWIFVSDRLGAPLLPIRPYALVVYDYLQRYVNLYPTGTDESFLAAARAAERVLVTTRFTEQDALTYAGVPKAKVVRVPMLAPKFPLAERVTSDGGTPYFLWTTNLGPHKNHYNAMSALRDYYELLDGQLDCRVSGVESGKLLKSNLPHLKSLGAMVSDSEPLSKRLHLLGEIQDALYRRQLANAAFLWHPARIDNGTFSVVEAAHLGVPSLSSKYPAMEEIDAQFGLNLTWMDANDPVQMSRQLKWMEDQAGSSRARLPSEAEFAQHGVEGVAREYWRAVRECL